MSKNFRKLAQSLYEKATEGKRQPWDSCSFPEWESLSDSLKDIWILRAARESLSQSSVSQSNTLQQPPAKSGSREPGEGE